MPAGPIPLEFHLGPLDFSADGTEAPNALKTFSVPTVGLPAGYYVAPVGVWVMQRLGAAASGAWACELLYGLTGAGPGSFQEIGSVQNYATLFLPNGNRIYTYSITVATLIPCMDPAIGTFSWRMRYTAGALLSGPFTLKTGFLGKLYPYA